MEETLFGGSWWRFTVPSGDPQVCELWETTDPFTGRTARAVVAELAPNVITLVSMTGNRTRVPANRIDLWRFVQAAPTHGMGCSRRGCRLAGVFRMDRDATPEWVCPRHMPIGTSATLDMSEHPGAAEVPQPIVNDGCPACDDRATSNVTRNGTFHVWSCSKCSYQWGTVAEPPGTHTDEWFWDTMIELRTYMEANLIPIRRIDVTPQVWGHFYRTHEREVIGGPLGARAFQGVPIHVVTGPESLHSIAIQSRDVGRVSTSPVSRLGGAPGRPAPSTHNALLELVRGPQEALREEVELGRRNLNGDILPVRSGVVYTSNPPSFPRNPPVAPSVPVPEPPEVDGEALGIPTARSLWVNRATGDLVEVTGRPSTSYGGEAVTFRRASATDDGIPEQRNTMLYADFMNLHRAWSIVEGDAPSVPEVLPVSGDEWEHLTDKTEIEVVTVDVAREIVHVVDRKVKRRRSIPLRDFASGIWRKVVRRTAFEHLMDDEL